MIAKDNLIKKANHSKALIIFRFIINILYNFMEIIIYNIKF